MSDYPVEILSASPGPCMVCGAIGGNCTGDNEYRGAIIIEPRKKHDPRATYRVRERIYEETMVGSRKVRRLIYNKGDSITPDEARRLGLLPSDKTPEIKK